MPQQVTTQSHGAPSTLHDQGFRFAYRASGFGYGCYNWVLQLAPGDVDVTDLDDDAFERFVIEHQQRGVA